MGKGAVGAGKGRTRADLPATRTDLEQARVILAVRDFGHAGNPTPARAFHALPDPDIHRSRRWSSDKKGGAKQFGETHGRSFRARSSPEQSGQMMSKPKILPEVLKKPCSAPPPHRQGEMICPARRGSLGDPGKHRSKLPGIAAVLPSFLRARLRGFHIEPPNFGGMRASQLLEENCIRPKVPAA